jgi:hypothetical protein
MKIPKMKTKPPIGLTSLHNINHYLFRTRFFPLSSFKEGRQILGKFKLTNAICFGAKRRLPSKLISDEAPFLSQPWLNLIEAQ